MNVHEIIPNSARPDLASVLDYELGEFDDSAFLDGYSLATPELLSQVNLYIDDSPTLPDLVGNPLSWLIVSRRLKSHLDNYVDSSDIDFYPVKLTETSRGRVHENFYVMNVIKHVTGLDKEASVFSESSDGQIEFVTKCIIRSAAVQGLQAFRLAECPDATFFSDLLATSLTGHDFRGIAFARCAVS